MLIKEFQDAVPGLVDVADREHFMVPLHYHSLNNYYAAKDFPEKIRRIEFKDEQTGKLLIFLTNNFHLKATEWHYAVNIVGRWSYYLNGSNNILK